MNLFQIPFYIFIAQVSSLLNFRIQCASSKEGSALGGDRGLLFQEYTGMSKLRKDKFLGRECSVGFSGTAAILKYPLGFGT